MTLYSLYLIIIIKLLIISSFLKLYCKSPWIFIYECFCKRRYTRITIHMITNIIFFYHSLDLKTLILWLIYLKSRRCTTLLWVRWFFYCDFKTTSIKFTIVFLYKCVFPLVLLSLSPNVFSIYQTRVKTNISEDR